VARARPGFDPAQLLQPFRRMSLPTDPTFWLVAAFCVLLLGLAKGGFAGVGAVATPILALLLPPLQAAAILLPIIMLQDAISVVAYRKYLDRWNLMVGIPGGILGVGIAGLLAAYVTDAHIRLTIGIIGVSFVMWRWFGPKPTDIRIKPSAIGGVFWSTISGFTSTLSHAGGPPWQVHILPQNLPKLVLAGTTACFFMVINYVKVIPFVALGQFSYDNIAVSLLLFPLAIATNFLGLWLVRVTPQETFYKIVYVFTFLVSLELIRNGLTTLWHG
jgi:uncharacterized membrane protein YfcA